MNPPAHGGPRTAFTSPCPLYTPSNVTARLSRRLRPCVFFPAASYSSSTRSQWSMCAAPGTPQKRKRTIPKFLDPSRDNPLMTPVGQREELKRAARSRKKGNWEFAAAILRAAHEYLQETTPFLTEALHVRSDMLSGTSPDLTPIEVFDDLMFIIDESSAVASVVTYNAVLVAIQKRISGKYHTSDDALDIALRILDVMNRRKVIPDDYSFSVLFGMCAIAGNLQYLSVFEDYASKVQKQYRDYHDNYEQQDTRRQFQRARHPLYGGSVACSSLVCARTKLGFSKDADTLFDEMRQHQVKASERAYACLIGALQRERQHARVVELWNSAMSQNAVKGPHIFSAVIASCCRADDTETARSATEWMLYRHNDGNKEPKKDVLSSSSLPFGTTITNASAILGRDCLDAVFSLAVRCGDISLAERIAFDWGLNDSEFKLTTVHGARLLSCVGRQEDLDINDAVEHLWEIIDRFHFVLCIDEDVTLLNAITDNLVRLGRPQDAVDVVLKRMPYRNVTPNEGSYKALIRANAKLGDMKAVVNVVKLMKTNGISPDYLTYNAVFHAAQACGEADVARLAMAAMKKIEPAVKETGEGEIYERSVGESTDVSILTALRRSRNVTAALQFHVSAVREGHFVDDKAYAIILSTLLDNHYDMEAISMFAWLVVHNRVGLSCYNAIIHQFGRRKPAELSPADSSDDQTDDLQIVESGYDIAERVFQRMKRKGATVADEVTYTCMVRACCTHGKLDRAFRLLAEIQDVGVGMSDTHAWSAVIDGCGRLGQWERGLELLRFMRSHDSKSTIIPRPTVTCYNAALYAAGVYGQNWQAMVSIFEMLQKDHKQSQRLSPSVVTFSAMASVILKCRNNIPVDDMNIVELVIDRLRHFAKLSDSEASKRKVKSKIRRLEWIVKINKEKAGAQETDQLRDENDDTEED